MAFELPAHALREQAERSSDLRRSLLDVSYDYQAQAALAAGCAALHHATERLAKSILVRSDRLQTSEIRLTQEELAQRLGLLRTTISSAAASLRAIGALKYSRGRIHILDRERLVDAACECYRAPTHCPNHDSLDP